MDPPTRTQICLKRKRESKASGASEPVVETIKPIRKRIQQQSQSISNGRFSGDIFTVIVGGKKRFTAHETILSKSPVFKAMCIGPFQESVTRTIELPDDDPLAFEILLETFYRDCTSSGVLRQICFEIIPADGDHPSKLADVYITANRYQLRQLQSVTVQLLRDLNLPAQEPVSFLTVAQTIYENLSSPQGPFPDYFRSEVRIALRDSHGVVMDKVLEIVQGGGALAIDISRAQAMSCRLERERTEACIQKLECENLVTTEEKERLRKAAANKKKKVEGAAVDDRQKLETLWKEEKAELMRLLLLAATNREKFEKALRNRTLASMSA